MSVHFEELLGDVDGLVLVVTNDFPPQHGGIQTYLRLLCDKLPADRLVVYAPAHPGAVEYDAAAPFSVIRDWRSTLLPSPGLTKRIRELVMRHDIRQVIFGASVPLGLLAPSLRRAGVQHVLAMTHGHEVWWAVLPGTRSLLRRVVEAADVVTYVSDYTGECLRRSLGEEAAARLVLLTPEAGPEFHPGVDGRGVRAKHGLAPSDLVVVSVARLVRRKGQDRLIKLWPDLMKMYPHARLLLVGTGPDRQRLERLTRRRGLEAVVTFAGAADQVAPYYAASDVFAMPVRSRWWGLEVEGYGISYVEAAACGLPIVAGTSGGTAEAVKAANAISRRRS